MKQKRIAECKCNSLAPYSGKEANGKIEYGKNLMKHRKIYLAVSIGCLLMAAIYYQIASHFLINRNPFFYCALPALIIGLCAGHRLFLSSIECNIWHHPSYIYVYRRKRIDEYINEVERIIKRLL